MVKTKTAELNHATLRKTNRVLWIAVTGLFMAMNIALATLGVPVPGGHLYLCDVVICTASMLLDPLGAFAVGGIGSFIGDYLFYQPPMFVSLVTHGIQAVVISLVVGFFRTGRKPKFLRSLIALLIGAVIMVTGYTLGKIFVYSTLEYAIIKLPYEIAQGALGAVLGWVLCWKCRIHGAFSRYIAEDEQH